MQRVFGNEAAGNVDWQEEPLGTWLLAPPHWAPTQIIHAEQSVDTIPAGMAPTHEPEYERYAGLGWSLAITASLWSMIAFGMFVWGWTITLKPYVWLLLLSIVTLPFAPLPVSVAAMLLAIAGPVLERRR